MIADNVNNLKELLRNERLLQSRRLSERNQILTELTDFVATLITEAHESFSRCFGPNAQGKFNLNRYEFYNPRETLEVVKTFTQPGVSLTLPHSGYNQGTVHLRIM